MCMCECVRVCPSCHLSVCPSIMCFWMLKESGSVLLSILLRITIWLRSWKIDFFRHATAVTLDTWRCHCFERDLVLELFLTVFTHWCIYAHLPMPTHTYVGIRKQEWDVCSPYKTDDIWDIDVQGVGAGDKQLHVPMGAHTHVMYSKSITQKLWISVDTGWLGGRNINRLGGQTS